jgi:hypothetical protein
MAALISLTNGNWNPSKSQALARFFSVYEIPSPRMAAGVQTLSPDWDSCNWPDIARRSIGAARDSAYMHWRYTHHPYFKYRFITVPEKGRTGLLVWRLETIRLSTPDCLVDLDRIGRVVEFLPISLGNARDLVSSLLTELLEADAIGADYYGHHGETCHWLNTLGFRQSIMHPDGIAIPSRFQPLDFGGGQMRSALLAPQSIPRGFGRAECAWYWTKSDGDQDRPN